MPLALTPDLFKHKEAHFVLWRPARTGSAPRLIIGKLKPGNPPALVDRRVLDLTNLVATPGLWKIAAAECGLVDGEVYHYWFEIQDTNPYKQIHPKILCTDPTAWTVDWRLLAPTINEASFGEDDRDPAAVVKFVNGRLEPCDPGGESFDWAGDTSLAKLPANNRLVIYELPTAWARIGATGDAQVSVGTFRDVLSLIESGASAVNFAGTACLNVGRAHLLELGANALELLPPADSFVDREWGYATSNYFAPDHDLGFPKGNLSPAPNADLVRLIKASHSRGVRFFADMVAAFATRYSYQNIDFLDFHVQANSGDPEEFANGARRDAFGGDLFKYNFWTETYDPVSGKTIRVVPARALMLTYLARWMVDFRIDGIRMDSIPNIANWDFVQEFKDYARALWHERWANQGNGPQERDERFLVVGEDLGVDLGWVTQNRLDGLWNENFKRLVRCAIIGENDEKEPSFEWTVRKLVDCRLLGFRDGAQAINYVTSHDVEGFRNERLFNFLNNNGIVETEKRIKLAFVCMLTAVGIPMIFAGEEFADEHDLPVRHPQKQVDPVNFDRLEDDWRQRLFQYVSRLVKLRTSYDALATNDTQFIHVDFAEGKRALVWKRGQESSGKLVVVVANFSDYGTPAPFVAGAEYFVPNWPSTPAGKRWREITQDRDVPVEWIGREPIFPWEAKVYALV